MIEGVIRVESEEKPEREIIGKKILKYGKRITRKTEKETALKLSVFATTCIKSLYVFAKKKK